MYAYEPEKRGNLAESLNGEETPLGHEEAYAKFLGYTNCSGQGAICHSIKPA